MWSILPKGWAYEDNLFLILLTTSPNLAEINAAQVPALAQSGSKADFPVPYPLPPRGGIILRTCVLRKNPVQ
jgi:hypothetical protein